MNLVANLDFNRSELEELIEEKVRREGYVLHESIAWREDGSMRAEVRPMTPEEKEEAGMDPRNPVQKLSEELSAALEASDARIHSVLQGLFELIDQLPTRITPPEPDKGDFSSKPPSEEGISVVEPTDYGLEEDASEEEITSRARIARIRREQQQEPERYSDHVKDEDGFVVLAPKK